MPAQARARTRDSNLPPLGSQTITSTPTNDSASDDQAQPTGGERFHEGEIGVLRLRGGPVRNQRVVWAEEVVDNEGLGRKSSKICCIYHKPRPFDESSSDESSSSSSSSDSDSGNAASGPSRPPDHSKGKKKDKDLEKGSGDESESESDGGKGDGGARPRPKPSKPKTRRPNRFHKHSHSHTHRDDLTHDRRHVHTAECTVAHASSSSASDVAGRDDDGGAATGEQDGDGDGVEEFVEVNAEEADASDSMFEDVGIPGRVNGDGEDVDEGKGDKKVKAKAKAKARAFMEVKPNYLERGGG